MKLLYELVRLLMTIVRYRYKKNVIIQNQEFLIPFYRFMLDFLKQYPASNDEKQYGRFWEQTYSKLFDVLSIYHK